MKIISNKELIKRNATIGQATSLASLLVLGFGMYISFKEPEKFSLSMGALLLGFVLFQVGIYYGNRWGRSPRPDELLDQGLKGLSNQYTMYHYSSPIPNLLVGPAGVWILIPLHQHGEIIYTGKKWKTKGGGFMQAYMGFFGQESMSRPDLEAGARADKLLKALKKEMPEDDIPPINAAIVFTNKAAEVHADNAPVPTLHLKQLKPFIRKKAKETPLPVPAINAVNDALQQEG